MTTSSNYTVRFLRAASGPLGTAMAVEHIANFAANELERLEKEHADKIVEITRNYDNELAALRRAAYATSVPIHIETAFEAGRRARAEIQKLKDELAGAKRTIETQQKALEHQAVEVRELQVLNSQLAGSALAGLLSRAFPDRYVYTPSGIVS